MGKKFIVIVLDGFGIGAMKDAKEKRPGDEISSTLGSLLRIYPDLKLKNLERLGLMNAFGAESEQMYFSKQANYGKSELMHFGADTFMGHQEIMGTRPQKPLIQPFQEKVDEISFHLKKNHHQVEIRETAGLRYLLVDDYVTVADNIDADFGMAYNLTAPLDQISFSKELEIARLVRQIAKVNRVIPFGGRQTTITDILNAEETREGKYIGIHAVKSGSYQTGYQCLHLGYGVDDTVQVPSILAEAGISVSLFGKVADIVANEKGRSVSCVNTAEVMDLTIAAVKEVKNGFICTNVQETDLAGHSQDAAWYKNLLETVDAKLGELLPLLSKEDILLICADHGNDPEIGHNRHTRENVPILVKMGEQQGISFGLRQTLSDIGATVCDYFGTKAPENGTTLLDFNNG